MAFTYAKTLSVLSNSFSECSNWWRRFLPLSPSVLSVQIINTLCMSAWISQRNSQVHCWEDFSLVRTNYHKLEEGLTLSFSHQSGLELLFFFTRLENLNSRFRMFYLTFVLTSYLQPGLQMSVCLKCGNRKKSLESKKKSPQSKTWFSPTSK